MYCRLRQCTLTHYKRLPRWSKLKYLNHYWMDYYEILHRNDPQKIKPMALLILRYQHEADNFGF